MADETTRAIRNAIIPINVASVFAEALKKG
jgi:hypothetical protein